MNINFRSITEENFSAIINMKRPEKEGFVASNAVSLAQAWLYRVANDAAKHVYEKLGFVPTGEISNGNEVVMKMEF